MTQDTSGLQPAAPAAGRAADNPPTTRIARDQAGHVGNATTDAGRHVADTAKEQAGQVAQQARREAKDLYHEARGQVTEQARGGQQQATRALRALAAELHEMTGGEHHGPASDLAAQAASRVDDLAGWLDEREPGDLVQEVRNFARRRPGAFLVGAALAGVLAGRLTRGVVDANRDDGSATPTPSQLAAPPAYPPAPPGYPAGPPPAAPPAPMPYDQPGSALPAGGRLDAPPGPSGVPSAEPRPSAPGVAPAGAPPTGVPGARPPVPPLHGDPDTVAPRQNGPTHALRPEGTTVGEYVEDIERGPVPPLYEPDSPR